MLIATFAAAFLPQAVWANWPSQWVLGLGGVAFLIWALIDGCRSGKFITNHGVLSRTKSRVKFYTNAGLLLVLILTGIGFLVAMHPFAQ